MAAVMINTGPIDYRDEMSSVNREKWNELFVKRRLYIHTEFEHGCECVIDWLAEAEQFYVELGYETPDQMLEQELEIPPDWVRMAAAVLQAAGQNLSKSEVDRAIELKAHGRPKKGEEGKGDNVTFKVRGNDSDYIKARLRRDHPEIAERLEAGEFKSARQAGIAAGFVKNIPTLRITSDVSKIANCLKQHLDEQQLSLLRKLL